MRNLGHSWSPRAFLRRAVGLVGKKVFETMARLDKLLQKYTLSHKLNLIQNLNQSTPEHSRSRILPSKTKGRPARYMQRVVKTFLSIELHRGFFASCLLITVGVPQAEPNKICCMRQ